MMRFVVLGGIVSALAFAGCLEGYPADEGEGDGAGDGPGSGNGDGAGDGTGDGTGEGDGTGGDDRASSYVFAWVTGNYTATAPSGDDGYVGICGWPSEPDVDETEKTITFRSAGRDEFEGRDVVGLRGLLLVTQWDYSACGVLVTRVATVWTADEPTAELQLLGNVTLGVRFNREDGSVTLYQDETPEENAIHVEPGAGHSAHYEGETEDGGTFEANYTLRALGHWPTEGVILAEDDSGGQPL